MFKYLVVACAVLVSYAALSADFVSTVVTLNSADAGVIANAPSKEMSLSCDGEVRYLTCKSTDTACVAADTTSYFKVSTFSVPYHICMAGNYSKLALVRTALNDGGTVTCSVGQVIPVEQPCK